MKRINNGWEFTTEFNESFLNYENHFETVRIPHTVKELDLHYIDPEDYQMISGYRKKIFLSDKDISGTVFLQFDGAAHIATIYVNRKEVCSHYNGYTAFRADITKYVSPGDNEIVVRLDSTENSAIPPFGFVIDYLTYGGIYRDVWLDIRGKEYIEDTFVSGDMNGNVTIDLKAHLNGSCRVYAEIYNEMHERVKECNWKYSNGPINTKIDSPILWNPGHGYLYKLVVTLKDDERILDCASYKFGFRTIRTNENHILINDKEVFIYGLNRHQCYPYVGYAATEHLQREDVRILDEELGVNAVRTSHYPQSHYFIDECDKRGILVFTEIPGWQHLSKDEKWRDQCVENVREMVLQYRNHPSIFMWGVRVNESQDDDELYLRTNKVAHDLDNTRPTSGVRYITKSSLLEDVYAYNDFSHNGITPGCQSKKEVTPDMKKPLIISEANGHMYPTKSFDPWSKREEHALRHARVLNAAMSDGEHAGCYQWCMFDYPTHQDFGSGDKICYHGVMDSFRNPKLAASVYSSQSDKIDTLTVTSSMDIGDYPGGQISQFYCFSNADYVNLYKNDQLINCFKNSDFKGLKHGPLLIDDLIGNLLEQNEGYDKRKANLIRNCLKVVAKYGLTNVPLDTKVKLGYAMVRYKMSFQDAVDLYGKYIGNWGGKATEWKFEAVKDGNVIGTVIKTPGHKLHLDVKTSQTVLVEGDCYDMAAVRIQILDEFNNLASYSQLPVKFETEGCITLIGPDAVTAEGAMTGTYIKTTGQKGKGKLIVSCNQLEKVELEFEVK